MTTRIVSGLLPDDHELGPQASDLVRSSRLALIMVDVRQALAAMAAR
jgi:hypothetical protein